MNNVFELARKYRDSRAEFPNDPYKVNPAAKYHRDLLARINGAGYIIRETRGEWFLIDKQDNRKKWKL